MIGAAALHHMVAVGQGGKFGLGRYGAIGGRKGLFLTLAGKFTKKTLARVYSRVVGKRCPGVGTPGFLLYPWRDFPTLERLPQNPKTPIL